LEVEFICGYYGIVHITNVYLNSSQKILASNQIYYILKELVKKDKDIKAKYKNGFAPKSEMFE
jgi:hypothetical protein